ncbi:cupin domain-containing protein [Actinocorallia longicatena]|uniref:Cupin domain-containing protein n=1 Tax=Actinocorallia longicatena TaxID=111803 RepID=A0ABP6Q6P5_9ACTN
MSTDVIQVLGGDFPAQHLGRNYAHLPAPDGQQGRFADLLTWEALNAVLDSARLEAPRLRLALDGDTVPPHLYSERQSYRRMQDWMRPIPPLVHQQIADGATLVLDTIDELHPPVRDLASELERLLRRPVTVNVYASWTSREGFGTHWDDHDVLVFQVSGRKRWRIYGPTRPSPMYRDVVFADVPPEQPLAELTLGAGDVLYVPRGWWHAAAASEGEPSLHLSCGLGTHTGADLLGWVVDRLRDNDTVRADVPRFATGAERAAWAASMAKLLAEELTADVVERYGAARDAAATPRGGFSLPLAVAGNLEDPGTIVRFAVTRPVIDHHADGVTVAAGGRRWTLDAAAGPVFELLAGGQPLAVSALADAAGLPVDLVAGMLQTMLDAGVVSAAEVPR